MRAAAVAFKSVCPNRQSEAPIDAVATPPLSAHHPTSYTQLCDSFDSFYRIIGTLEWPNPNSASKVSTARASQIYWDVEEAASTSSSRRQATVCSPTATAILFCLANSGDGIIHVCRTGGHLQQDWIWYVEIMSMGVWGRSDLKGHLPVVFCSWVPSFII